MPERQSYTSQCSQAPATDGFHSIVLLGIWRALHHHAPCWLVNIHITWPFCLQFLWWKMPWNLSICKSTVNCVYWGWTVTQVESVTYPEATISTEPIWSPHILGAKTS